MRPSAAGAAVAATVLPSPSGPCVPWCTCRGHRAGLQPTLQCLQMLGKSLSFYAAQRSGHLGTDYAIPWRGDSGLADVSPTGSSLVGGYYDNGGACPLPVRRCCRLALVCG